MIKLKNYVGLVHCDVGINSLADFTGLAFEVIQARFTCFCVEKQALWGLLVDERTGVVASVYVHQEEKQ